MAILKIHGCSGAGKTTAVRELMKASQVNKVVSVKGTALKTEGYSLTRPDIELPIFVLGSYDNNCGGMDTVSSAKEAMSLVHKYFQLGHVVHEGLLQSTYYGAMGTDSLQYGDEYIYVFLDTPIELCLERVVARREANGSTNKFNPQLTRDKYDTIERLRLRLLNSTPHKVAVLHHDQPMLPQLLGLLK
jgi:adenylate kinase family enzyme